MWWVETYFCLNKKKLLQKTFLEVGLSLYWVPDLLPFQHDSVPVELHRHPAGLCPLSERKHVLASCHGSHTHYLDCQKQEHDGENQM